MLSETCWTSAGTIISNSTGITYNHYKQVINDSVTVSTKKHSSEDIHFCNNGFQLQIDPLDKDMVESKATTSVPKNGV